MAVMDLFSAEGYMPGADTIMTLGPLYRCQNPRCRCEIQVISTSVEVGFNRKCFCGAEMKKTDQRHVLNVRDTDPGLFADAQRNGERFVCASRSCRAVVEVKVLPDTSEKTSDLRCRCGSKVKRVYSKPIIQEISKAEALLRLGDPGSPNGCHKTAGAEF
jgi:hypothetical protein